MRNLIPTAVLATSIVVFSGCSQPAKPPTPTQVATAVKTGSEASRRDVKTAIDADASKINWTPKDTTIEDIAATRPPAGIQSAGRTGPFETTTWKVDATLKSFKLMPDHDFYLVMKGEKGGEAVVEVPDPNDCKGSPLQSEIASARKTLEERYHPTTDVKSLNDPATVIGVGFLGFGGKKKKSGAHSGGRLMPGLDFNFKQQAG